MHVLYNPEGEALSFHQYVDEALEAAFDRGLETIIVVGERAMMTVELVKRTEI